MITADLVEADTEEDERDGEGLKAAPAVAILNGDFDKSAILFFNLAFSVSKFDKSLPIDAIASSYIFMTNTILVSRSAK